MIVLIFEGVHRFQTFGSMEPLEKLYRRVLTELCSSWIQNCDGGCQAEHTTRKVLKEDSWTFIWQPKKGFAEQETSEVSLFFLMEDHIQLKHDFYGMVERVHKDFQDEFKDLLSQTDNRWLEACDGTVESILHLTDWDYDNGRMKTTQTLRGGDLEQMGCHDYAFSLPSFGGRMDMDERFRSLCRQDVHALNGE